MTIYSTRPEAVQAEIIAPLEASGVAATEFDIDAISDELIEWADGAEYDYPLNHQGFVCVAGADSFWSVVEDHAL